MEETYDVIILGTGFKQCLLSGLLAVSGKRVLHIDKLSYYGQDTASVTIQEANKYFSQDNTPKGEDSILPELSKDLGSLRDYSVDLCPKFVLASGNMFKALRSTAVTNYMEFVAIDEVLVYLNKSLSKVPTKAMEALKSSLIGFFQKNKLRSFLTYVNGYTDDPSIQDLSAKAFMKSYGLDDRSQALVYHVLGLYVDEKALDDSSTAKDLVLRIKNFQLALMLGKKSPFIYPRYGLGTLPEGFSRLSSVYNSVFMLDTPFDGLVFEDSPGLESLSVQKGSSKSAQKIKGIRSGDKAATASIVVGDCNYFPEYSQVKGTIAKFLLVTNERPLGFSRDCGSFMLVIPGLAFKRTHDVYVTCLSSEQKVCPKGRWLLMIRCVKEKQGADLKGQLESHVVPLLLQDWKSKVVQSFYKEEKILEPAEVKDVENLFLFGSVDTSAHFEEDTKDVLNVFERIMGKRFDLENFKRGDGKT